MVFSDRNDSMTLSPLQWKLNLPCNQLSLQFVAIKTQNIAEFTTKIHKFLNVKNSVSFPAKYIEALFKTQLKTNEVKNIFYFICLKSICGSYV